MELRDLLFFETIADLGHLGQAAEKIGRTKPALTKCIRRLEDEIGAPLFAREGRRIVLTEVGEVLREVARHMHTSMDEAVLELGRFVTGSAGHVRIGTGPTVAEYILPSLFERLLVDMPRVKTEIVVDLGNTLRDSLENGKVDLILSTILPTDADKFVAYPFAQDEVVVVASRNHPLVGKPCGLADLLHYNWALPGPNVATRQWVEWAFKSRGLRSPEVQIETSSLQVLPTLIAGTTVLGFTPRSNLGPGRVASQLVELQCEEVTMSRQLGMLHRKTGTLSPVLRRILALAKDVTRSDRLDAALAHRA